MRIKDRLTTAFPTHAAPWSGSGQPKHGGSSLPLLPPHALPCLAQALRGADLLQPPLPALLPSPSLFPPHSSTRPPARLCLPPILSADPVREGLGWPWLVPDSSKDAPLGMQPAGTSPGWPWASISPQQRSRN